MQFTHEQAWDLLKEYNQEPFHLRHALTVEAVMGWFADALGYGEQAEFWRQVGLLHDLDFEQFPQEHCHKEALIHAVVSHGYQIGTDVEPEPFTCGMQ